MAENIIVGVIVAGAAVWLALRLRRAAKGTKGTKGCGCCGRNCGARKDA